MFDLEKAISDWRRQLNAYAALEDGFKAELEAHLRDGIDDLTSQGMEPEEAFTQAVDTMGPIEKIGAEYFKTTGRRRFAPAPQRPEGFSPALIWNYLTVGLRRMRKHLGFSSVNILGLAVGMACCLIIFLYVAAESSYDSHYPDHHRIYRVVEDIRKTTASRIFAPIAMPAGPALKENYPEVEYSARLYDIGTGLVKYGDKVFYEQHRFIADADVFNIFAIPFLAGQPHSALDRPNTAVISRQTARKLFGDTDPMGQIVQINDWKCEITAVVADPPATTHWKYSLMVSLATLGEHHELINWYNTMAYTYIKLAPRTDLPRFEQRMRRLADPYIGENDRARGVERDFLLQPLDRIHLHSHVRYEMEPPGNAQLLRIFSIIGFLILLIACINFTNLTTARSFGRAREVGMRKVLGGSRRQLVFQFLGETFLQSAVAMVLAIGLIWLSLPLLRQGFGLPFHPSGLLEVPVILMFLALSLFTGLTAGLYPAFVLSAFKPAESLKTQTHPGSARSLLRRVLVVVQFSIAILLIVSTMVARKQMTFIKNHDLGFDQQQKLVIPFRRGTPIQNRQATVKAAFLQVADVSAATFSSTVPGRGVSNFNIELVGEENDRSQSMFHLYFDPDFIANYGIRMAAGRPFDKRQKTDAAHTFLINRAALGALGIKNPEDAVGKVLKTGYGGRDNRIIGVTENFHYRGLQMEVEPLVMEWLPDELDNLTLNISTSRLNMLLPELKQQWRALFPGYPYEYFFLDQDFNRQYEKDDRTAKLFAVFTLIGQIIACLGLFGLATHAAQLRTKEIGIRKALGASVSGMIILLCKDFVRWVLLANIFAWPAAYWVAKKWLANFAYQTPLGPEVFIFSGVIALFTALITVGYQSLKAALANPVDSLRYE